MSENRSYHSTQQPPLFHISYKLFCNWYIRCQSLPKKDRYSIGQRTEGLILELVIAITTAYHSKDVARKREFLSQAHVNLESLKVILRLAKDVRALDQRWYIEYETQVQEIGKMIGGWMTSLNKTSR